MDNEAQKAADGMQHLATTSGEQLTACAAMRDKVLDLANVATDLTTRVGQLAEATGALTGEFEQLLRFIAFQQQAWERLASEYAKMAGGGAR